MNTKLNKSDYKILAIYFIVAVLINIKTYFQNSASTFEFFVDIPMFIITVLLTIIIFSNWLIPKFIIQQKNFFLFAFFGIATLSVFGSITIISDLWTEGNDWRERFSFLDLVLRRSLVSSTSQSAFPFALVMAKKFYEGQTEYLKIEKQQKENELKLLRGQLDPHFLFNNLNTLDALIDSNPTKAKEYINRLSLIYRYLIQTKDSEVMELSEELTLAENYFFLIKTRFGNDYDFNIEKQVSIDDKFIPTGAIQTLLENVVKHNKVSNGKTIKTTIEINENSLAITNEKSKLRSVNPSFGTGLENLKTRYKLLTDKEVLVKNLEDSFLVSIPVINLEA